MTLVSSSSCVQVIQSHVALEGVFCATLPTVTLTEIPAQLLSLLHSPSLNSKNTVSHKSFIQIQHSRPVPFDVCRMRKRHENTFALTVDFD